MNTLNNSLSAQILALYIAISLLFSLVPTALHAQQHDVQPIQTVHEESSEEESEVSAEEEETIQSQEDSSNENSDEDTQVPAEEEIIQLQAQEIPDREDSTETQTDHPLVTLFHYDSTNGRYDDEFEETEDPISEYFTEITLDYSELPTILEGTSGVSNVVGVDIEIGGTAVVGVDYDLIRSTTELRFGEGVTSSTFNICAAYDPDGGWASPNWRNRIYIDPRNIDDEDKTVTLKITGVSVASCTAAGGTPLDRFEKDTIEATIINTDHSISRPAVTTVSLVTTTPFAGGDTYINAAESAGTTSLVDTTGTTGNNPALNRFAVIAADATCDGSVPFPSDNTQPTATTVAALTDGEYKVCMEVTNVSDNLKVYDATEIFTLDTAAPTGTYDRFIDNGGQSQDGVLILNSGNSIAIFVNLSENLSESITLTGALFNNQTEILTTNATVTDRSAQFSFAIADDIVSNGNVYFAITNESQVTDLAGNSMVSFDRQLLDNTALLGIPFTGTNTAVVRFIDTAPFLNGDTYINSAESTGTNSIIDTTGTRGNDPDLDRFAVIAADATCDGSVPFPSDNTQPTATTITSDNPDGEYKVCMQVSYASNNSNAYAETNPFISDTIAPTIGNITVTFTGETVSNNVTYLNEGDTVTVTVPVTEADQLQSNPELVVQFGSSPQRTLTPTTTTSTTYTYEYTVSATDTGSLTYNPGAITDRAGNTVNPSETTEDTIIAITSSLTATIGTPTYSKQPTNGVTYLTTGDTITVPVSFSQAPTNGTSITGQLLSSGTPFGNPATATVSGTTANVVFTVQDGWNVAAGTLQFDITNETAITDQAGNQLATTTPQTISNVVIDTTAPTIGNITVTFTGETVTNSVTYLNEGDTVTVTVPVTEADQLQSSPELVVQFGSSPQRTLTPTSTTPTTYTYEYTVSATDSGSLTYNLGAVTDRAGNTVNPSAVTPTGTDTIIADTTAPTIGNITITFTGETVSNNVTYLNEGDTVTVTVPVTEADQLQSSPELVVQFGSSPQRTLTPTTTTPTTYTYEYTIATGDTGSLTYNLSAVTDRAGNTVNPSETTENTIIAVTSSLTATIGTPTYSKSETNGTTYLTTGDTITVPVSFSQAPTDGTSITGQLLSSGTPFGNPATATVSGTTANVVFTVQSGDNVAAGTLQFDITNETAITDQAGNQLATTTPQTISNVVIDTTAPTIGNITVTFTGQTVTNSVTYLNEGDTITITVPVTEANQLQSSPELVVQFGSSPQRTLTPTTTTPTTYTYEYTIATGDTGSLTYNLSAVTDRAGNTINPSETTENTIIADTTTPTIGTITVTATGTQGDGVTQYLGIGDTLTVTVPVTEAEGLVSAPTMAIQFGIDSEKTVPATNSNPTPINDIYTYTYTYTVVDGDAGTFSYDPGVVRDRAGNTSTDQQSVTPLNPAFSASTVAVAVIAQTFSYTGAEIADSVTYLTTGDTITATVTLSIGSVDVTGQLFSGASPISSPVTDTADGSGVAELVFTVQDGWNVAADTLQFDITNETAITDQAGNQLATVSPQTISNVVIDTTTPTIGTITIEFTGQTVTNSVTYLNEGDTVTITVPVTEADQLQSSPELVVQFGSSPQRTLTPTTTTPTTYTYEYTVSATDSGSLTYNLGAVTDRAGNTVNPSATTEDTIIADITTPQVGNITVTFTGETVSNNNTYLNEGDTVTITVPVTEANQLQSSPELVVQFGNSPQRTLTPTTMTPAGATTTYTYEYTIATGDTGSLTYNPGAVTDRAGNTVNPSATTEDTIIAATSSLTATIGTTTYSKQPTNGVTYLTTGDTITVPVSFSQAPTNGTSITGQLLSSGTPFGNPATATVSGTTANVVFTVQDGWNVAAGTLQFDITNETAITDQAGNQLATVSPQTISNVVIDTTTPTVGTITIEFTGQTVSNNNTYLNQGDTVTVTVPVTEADQLQSSPELVVQFGSSPQRTLTPTSTTPTTYTYEYTIATGDTGSLTYNLGAVTDRAGNTVNPSATTEDTIIAVTSSLTATIGTPTYSKQPTNGVTYLTTGDTITVPVSFSQAPTNGTNITGQLLSSGTPLGDAISTTISGTTASVVFTVQSGDNVAAGTLQFDITNETAITDQAGNQLATVSPQTISNVVIDTTAPTIGAVSIALTGQIFSNSINYLNQEDTVTVTVPVTEADQLQSSPELVVQFGSSPQRTLAPVTTTPSGTTTTYTYEYTVSVGDNGSLTYNLNAITDRVGNTIDQDAVTPTGTDTIIAITSSLTATIGTPTYSKQPTNGVTYLTTGDTITVPVSFSQAPTDGTSITGQLLNSGTPLGDAISTTISGTTASVVFTIQSGDTVAAGNLQFDITNETAITDQAGNQLVTVSPQTISNVVIDTTETRPRSSGGGGSSNSNSNSNSNNNNSNSNSNSNGGFGMAGLSLFGEQSFTNTFIKGTDSPQIRIFQQQLNEQGYTVALTGPGSPGQETTYFGDQTEQAVLKFQAANNLLQTGVFDHDTQVALLNGSERVMLIKSIIEQIASIQARIQEIIFQQQTEELPEIIIQLVP